MRVGQRVMQRRREVRVLHHILRPARPPPRQRMQLRMLADDPEITEPEVLHHARRRADVAGFLRLDENDAEWHAARESILPRRRQDLRSYRTKSAYRTRPCDATGDPDVSLRSRQDGLLSDLLSASSIRST